MGEEFSRFLPYLQNQVRTKLFVSRSESEIKIMRPQPENTRSSNPRATGRGFSLIELLIVVAVILIIAAIAIPNYIQSKLRANEASAVQNLRNISTAEALYSSTYGLGCSPTLVSLSGTIATPDSGHAELIDSVLGGGVKSGYTFSYAAGPADSQGNIASFALNAGPLVPGSTGQRYFFTDQTNVIRVNPSSIAGPTDPAIQ
jgi:type IV pilus assembly protein PilA